MRLVSANAEERKEAVKRTQEHQCRDCNHGCSIGDMLRYCDGYQQELKEVKEDRRLTL